MSDELKYDDNGNRVGYCASIGNNGFIYYKCFFKNNEVIGYWEQNYNDVQVNEKNYVIK